MIVLPTTRAYTLKLSGNDDWRHAVWRTHCTVSAGVRAWGDWLLTLRGALPASLGKKDPGRRTILALSWLSVESPATFVPSKHIVASGAESREDREEKVKSRFRQILKRLEVKDADDWIADCEPALTARIRDDAVWVDRSAAFLEFVGQNKNGPAPVWAADTFLDLMGGEEDYFLIPKTDAPPATEGKDFVIKAGNWLSRNWGSGEKSDAGAIGKALNKLAQVADAKVVGATGNRAIIALLEAVASADGEADPEKCLKRLKQAVGWKGRPSKGAMALEKLRASPKVTAELWEEVQNKLREEAHDQKSKAKGGAEIPSWMDGFRKQIELQIEMPFRIQRDNIWEYAVMLDHALRRVSAGHTWIKRAEASRRQFKEDAAKVEAVPQAARDWLDAYCETRTGSSGADEEYLIRKRALDGWDDVVKTWSKLEDSNRSTRIKAVRDLQSNWDDNKKFGDVQLFAGFGDEDDDEPQKCLADDAATVVWQDKKGRSDPSILRNYVAARIAEHDQSRFKVPAYRHPDPLRHPVFVDFGNSRWSIAYSALKAVQDQVKLQEKIKKATTEKARETLKQQLAAKPDLHGVTLSLWTGEVIEPQALRWHGKRLHRDLDLDHFDESEKVVSRADRMGRSVASQPRGAVEISQVFEQSDWSGRLQAPRRELDRLADLVYGRKRDTDFRELSRFTGKAAKQWARIKWFLSLSAKLQPSGPWLDYIEKLPNGWEYKKGRTGFYLSIAPNEGRKGRARLQLSRLPGLRILSIDLGHRYAAACAAWEAISAQEMERACKQADEVVRDDDDLYRHLKHKTAKKDKRGKAIVTTTIYRRIGPNSLPGNNKVRHPAPWARLDRQFLIRLQGEDHEPRRATAEEFASVKAIYEFLGSQIAEPKESFDLNSTAVCYPRIDEMLLDMVREVRRGLRRHGDYARIANAMTATEKLLPGGQSKKTSPDERTRMIVDALILWQGLANSKEYGDEFARILWREWVEKEFDGPQPIEIADDASRSDRKKKQEASRGPLQSVALQLSHRDNSDLHRIWKKQWEARTAEWQKQLRELRKIILPRIGKRPDRNSTEFPVWKQKAKTIRDVGGLSYNRLSTIRALYQVMKAFHSRPEPGDLRAGIRRIEEEAEKGYKFGDRMLEALERLRENRIKQLASRIVEAALGIGSEDRRHWEDGRKRPRQRIDNPRFAPCHAVIVENLENYRPEETRMRRENRQLMTWAARNVRKYIAEGCHLNGLHFDEVSAAYTSRQDSRTGQPGIRCVDVPVKKFLEPVGLWRRQIERAEKRITEKKADARDVFLIALFNACSAKVESKAVLRIPNRSGEIFVSSVSTKDKVTGLQADLNAAANIGLKAFFDPDWAGSWWYVPCNAKGVPLSDKTKGSEVAELDQPLTELSQNGDAKNVINLWRDPSSQSLDTGSWHSYQTYWNDTVPARVIELLRKHNGLTGK